MSLTRFCHYNETQSFLRPPYCPSILLSGRFLEIGLLIFYKFWHSVRNSYEVVRGRARFFEKRIFAQKIGFLKSLKSLVLQIWSYFL